MHSSYCGRLIASYKYRGKHPIHNIAGLYVYIYIYMCIYLNYMYTIVYIYIYTIPQLSLTCLQQIQLLQHAHRSAECFETQSAKCDAKG